MMAIFKRIKSLMMVGSLCVLLVTNVMTVANAKVYDFMHNLLSLIPTQRVLANSKSTQLRAIHAENRRLKKRVGNYEHKAKLRKVKLAKAHGLSRKISKRVARNVAMNVTSIAGESLPYLGIGVILSVTAADVYAGCQTIKDTNELLTLLGESPDSQQQDSVCGMQVPSLSEVSQAALDYSAEAQHAFSDWLNQPSD
ncbi:hypothetical protein M1D72_05505 [Vibrio sp. AK197]